VPAGPDSDRQHSESATLIGSPETEVSKLKQEHGDNTSRDQPIACVDRVFGSHPPSRGTSISSLTQTSSPQFSQEPAPARQITPSQHPSRVPSRAASTRHSIPASPSLPSPVVPSEISQDRRSTTRDTRDPSLLPILTGDDQLRKQMLDEPVVSSAASGSVSPDRNQRRQPVTPAASIPPSPPPSERRPVLSKADRHYSPSPPASFRPRSTSLQSNQASSSRRPLPPRPDYYRPPATEGSSSDQHYRPPPSSGTSPPPRSATAVIFGDPLLPQPSSSAFNDRARKRDRMEFERDSHGGPSREYRRITPARSRTDSFDDRERSKPRPKLEQTNSSPLLNLPDINSFSSVGQSSQKQNTQSLVMKAEHLEEGEVLPGEMLPTNSRPEEGEIDRTPARMIGVEVKPRIEQAANSRARPNKIGINHMDILYETRNDSMFCRMCRYAMNIQLCLSLF
jgi:hypothetical protein